MPESSTLTFLFTDIEGSTEKWEEQPERMADAVGRHDVLLRNTVEANGGPSSRRPATGFTRPFRRRPRAGAVIDIQPPLPTRPRRREWDRSALRLAHRRGPGARQRLLRRHHQSRRADHERRPAARCLPRRRSRSCRAAACRRRSRSRTSATCASKGSRPWSRLPGRSPAAYQKFRRCASSRRRRITCPS